MLATTAFPLRNGLKFGNLLCGNPKRTMYQNPYINRFKERSKTTGLTGLFVNENPHRSLKIVYGRILRTLEEIPVSAAYRKYTEQVIKRRLAIVEQESDIEKLEQKIGMGQVEELIEQAEYELQAARAVLDNKAWEDLVEVAPEEQWRWPI